MRFLDSYCSIFVTVSVTVYLKLYAGFIIQYLLCNCIEYIEGSPTKVVVNATFDREIGDWSAHVEAKWRQCVQLGIHNYDSLKREKLKANVADAGSTPAVTPRCMPVYYESLVQEPEKWMRRVYDFVGLPFNRDVLRHQEFINKRIRLSRSVLSKSVLIARIGVMS